MSRQAGIQGASCSAPHLAPPQPAHVPLTWSALRRFERVRVVAWTCHEHRVTFYELCQAGGLAFIRRTSTGKGKALVAQSEAWRCREAEAVWGALLSGTAR
ncbi:hypothetical protein FHS43_006127 [Streptosporangium becharense]|uniref:Uncharacterized protein n=1 Tax=Streptosporangium becharense TaxID=1816182 RepID=A0A7W9IHX9_9ACTN|nr:hypothetical protein [Streptosporangium becharense]MBB2914815.1 hypothetical protein [Streptosporangium becharense]MBB5820374.1 hypothetical protein [Streptosporangium becharense]